MAGERHTPVAERGDEAPGVTGQIALDGQDSLWLVDGAPLDVFAADPYDSSPRQFLGQLTPGALVAGSARGSGHVLTGYAQPGCTVRRLSVKGLTEGTGAPGLAPPAIADGVDETLVMLHGAIPAPDEPAYAAPMRDAEIELRAGEVTRCVGPVRWITVLQGAVRPGRVGHHRDHGPGEVVVVIEGEWLQAVTDCRISVRPTPTLLGSGRLWTHLAEQQDACLHAVDEWSERRSTDRDSRMYASAAMLAAEVARADEQLRAAVLPAAAIRAAAGRPEAGTSTRHAQARAACTRAAAAVGMDLGSSADGVVEEHGDLVLHIARAHRLPARPVTLPARWWRQDLGPLVCFVGEERRPAALLRARFGYRIHDDAVGRSRRVTAAVAAKVSPEAVMFYRRLPDQAVGGRQLTSFALRGTRPDQLRLFLAGLLAFVLGLGVPVVSGHVIGDFVPQGRGDLVVQACVAVLVASVVGAAFTVVSSIALLRMENRLDATLQAAVWYRLLHLPLTFYSRYTTGELANAAMGVNTIRTVISGIANVVFTASMMAAVNLGLLFWYSPSLAAATVALVVVHTAVFLAVRLRLVAGQRQLLDLQNKLSNEVFHLLRGLPKLRTAAAEGFAYSRWATSFAQNQAISLRVKRSQSVVVAMDVIYVPLGSLLIYALLAGPARGTLGVSGFITFIAAFSAVLSSMAQMTTAVATGGIVAPIFDKIRPVLQELPEVAADAVAPTRLSGEIELAGVSFRYGSGAPLVLRDVSVRIRAGEFVAVVGPTGCGKSTLLRLMIGFNEPTAGTVRYDGVSLAQLDAVALRRQCGVVLQHSAPFGGTVLRNICGSGSYAFDDVWAAVQMAGLDEDIRRMPLGLETLVSDGAPELSGGQRQRLMIAQALVRRPRILFFDEATSALDNVTQAVVAESTRSLSVTRVVIAHRLSTIMNADRVIVMDDGRIVQSGTPADLLADGAGTFAQLVARQRR